MCAHSVTAAMRLPRAFEEQGAAMIIPMEEGIALQRSFPFGRVVVMWVMLVTLVGGLLLLLIEGTSGRETASEYPTCNLTFADALFMVGNAVSGSGLSSVNMAGLHTGSHVVMCLAMQLGGSTLIAIVPVFLRLRALNGILPKDECRRFDVQSLHRQPQWLIEYKSLILLLRVVLVIHVSFYLLGLAFLVPRIAQYLDTNEGRARYPDASPWGWAIFLVVSAWNNAGFTLSADSLVPFHNDFAMLFAIGLLAVLGNVGYPLVVRGAIAACSACSHRTASRKVHWRYLLLNGRDVCTFLFGSQQSMMLGFTQLVLLLLHVSVMAVTSWDRNSNTDPGGDDFFMSLMTRHAGFSIEADLRGLHPAALAVYLIAMVLAPVPLVVAIQNTNPATRASPGEGEGSGSAGRGRGEPPQHARELRRGDERESRRRAARLAPPQHDQRRARDEALLGRGLDAGADTAHLAAAEPMRLGGGSTESSPASRAKPRGGGPRPPRPRRSARPQIRCRRRRHPLLPPLTTRQRWSSPLRRRRRPRLGRRGRAANRRQRGGGGGRGGRRRRGVVASGGSAAWRAEVQMVDTKLLLMRYRLEHGHAAPLSLQLQLHLHALRLNVADLVRSIVSKPSIRRDLIVLWLGWFALLCTFTNETDCGACDQQGWSFSVLFEAASALGNVGLSLGSIEHPDYAGVSFSRDLGPLGKCLVLALEFYGVPRAALAHRLGAHALPLRRDDEDAQAARGGLDAAQAERAAPCKACGSCGSCGSCCCCCAPACDGGGQAPTATSRPGGVRRQRSQPRAVRGPPAEERADAPPMQRTSTPRLAPMRSGSMPWELPTGQSFHEPPKI